ncbi:hypothetical protein NY486_13870, partial [Enterobacter hormaechei]|nr:hypothetical protein [Enterobacter hormaechei]
MPTPTRVLLLLAAAVAALLFVLWRPSTPPASDTAPPSPGGEAFRQRLVAVGDLHGGELLIILICQANSLPDINNAKRV